MKAQHQQIGYLTGSNGSTIDATSNNTVTYDIPTGYDGGTVYLNYLAYSTGGYIDVYAQKSSNGDKLFTARINTCTDGDTSAINSSYGGVRVAPIISGYHGFDQVYIDVIKGKFYCLGLGFDKQQDRTTEQGCCHADNVIGDYTNFSDSSIKKIKKSLMIIYYQICLIILMLKSMIG